MTITIRDAHRQPVLYLHGHVSDAYRERLQRYAQGIGGTLDETKPKPTGGGKPLDANWNWTGGTQTKDKRGGHNAGERKPELAQQLREAGITGVELAAEAGVSPWKAQYQMRNSSYSAQVIAAAEKMLGERAGLVA